ncbi:type II toxin-antitoxin system HicB family antitoxin [Methanolacinia petrolearia]|nr:type II toxin-antitoxin system HicB family antitoxin [Methanolacinia petrolearia]
MKDIITDNRRLKIMRRQLTAIIEKEDDGYVSFCPEYDIASQGDTVEEAHKNLQEALELFFETASPQEIQSRYHGEIYITRMDVAFG